MKLLINSIKWKNLLTALNSNIDYIIESIVIPNNSIKYICKAIAFKISSDKRLIIKIKDVDNNYKPVEIKDNSNIVRLSSVTKI